MKYTILIIVVLLISSSNTFSQAPNWAWAKNPGWYGFEDGASKICVDCLGNVYMTGTYSTPTISFGSFILTNVNAINDTFDIYIAKYDPNGNVLWAKSIGGRSDDFAGSVTTDSFGNVYLVGYFWSDSIIFESITLTNIQGHNGAGDIFIAKYDSTGNILWAKSAGGYGNDAAIAVSTDFIGNVYVAGGFQSSSITFGTTTLTNSDTINQVLYLFIAKYDSAGNVLWAKGTGGSYDDGVSSITTDVFGNLYITGGFQSDSITFGTITLINSSANLLNMFLVKYDSTGNVIWAKKAGGDNNTEGTSVSTNVYGNIYVCGSFQSHTLNFDSNILTLVGIEDLFLVKYDSTGNVLWAKGAGGNGGANASSVTVDNLGYVDIAGSFFGSTITIGSTILTNDSSGTMDIFLAKYDSSGNVIWSKSSGGIYNDYANSIISDQLGNIYIAGEFSSPIINFGIYPFTNPSNGQDWSIFIAKINNSTGIEEIKAFGGVSVYPNPASSNVIVKSEELRVKSGELRVVDVFGRVINTEVLTKASTEIDVNKWSAGVYFYEVKGEQKTHRGKFIKQ